MSPDYKITKQAGLQALFK